MGRNLILWVIDEQHRAEQQVSEASVKRHMPDVDTRCFVVKKGVTWYDVYIKTLRESLALRNAGGEFYESFIFLDSDTFLTEPIYDVFDILTKYDIVSTHAPARQTTDMPSEPKVPEGYCEMNTGVLGYRNGAIVRTLFDAWLENYYKLLPTSGDNDQSALRLTMFEQSTHAWIMPQEYNCRWHLGGFASGTVKVLHARSRDITKVAEEINRNTGMRVWEQGTFK